MEMLQHQVGKPEFVSLYLRALVTGATHWFPAGTKGPGATDAL
jgi:hypothetical protein